MPDGSIIKGLLSRKKILAEIRHRGHDLGIIKGHADGFVAQESVARVEDTRRDEARRLYAPGVARLWAAIGRQPILVPAGERMKKGRRFAIRPLPSRAESEEMIDELFSAERQKAALSHVTGPAAPKIRRQTCQSAFAAFAMLAEVCMDRLTANGWKVVSYVAVRSLAADPVSRQAQVSQSWDGTMVVISLKEFSAGVRLKRRWRDYGTGLSKSSVAAALNEPERIGVLVRQRGRCSAKGGNMASRYGIDWRQVREVGRHEAVQQTDWGSAVAGHTGR